jgi:hypothetical protein
MFSAKSLLVFLLICISVIVRAEVIKGEMMEKGPGTYNLLNNKSLPIRIPFRMHNKKPVFDVEINGQKAALMIDNGVLWDEVWLFGSPLVSKLNLISEEAGILGEAGNENASTLYSADDLTIKFDNIVFNEQPVLVSPENAGYARMFPGTDGQICNTFFKHFIVEFDFISNDVILHDPQKYCFEKDGSTLRMVKDEEGTHSVPFEFTSIDDKTYSDYIAIDFGGIYGVKIATNNTHKITAPDNAKVLKSYSIHGESSEYVGKLRSYKIGKYSFENEEVVFGDERTCRVQPGNLGVIGLPLFMRFEITFDYFNNNIYIYKEID